jgi:hypothetical protein
MRRIIGIEERFKHHLRIEKMPVSSKRHENNYMKQEGFNGTFH